MQRPTLLVSFAIAFMLCQCTFADNTIYAWGANDYGQLGLGVLANPVRSPLQVSFYNDKAAVSDIQLAGSYHIATTSDGSVYVSGNNFYGCLGLNVSNPTGNNTYTADPQLNPDLQGCSVVASRHHANAICGGKAAGWGLWSGNVIGSTTGVWPKKHIANNGPNPSTINVALDGTFITSSSGAVWAAGNNTNGRLALGDTLPRGKFAQATFFASNPIDTIYNSQTDHSCARALNNSLFCWGNNDQGQLGLGVSGGYYPTPQVVSAIDDGEYYISQVVFGQEHTLALSCGGAVLAWGTRSFGVIGDGANGNGSQPEVTVVPGLSDKNIVEIVAGANSNFARSSDGTWYVWGAGYGGVLATTSDFNVLTPQASSSLKNLGVTRIVSGASSKSAFGWNDPNAKTTTQNCPALTNECNGQNNCATSNNAMCIDTDRAYKCACDPGFQGDGYQAPQGVGCSDIDECQAGTDQCDPLATCGNTEGSYTCTCASGYHGNGYAVGATDKQIPLPGQGCIMDVDECDNSTLNNCSPWAQCTDTVWAYNCTCQPGFTGDGVHCKDINECLSSPCGSNSVCTNTNGSFSCACNKGFDSAAGNGSDCKDIDECTSGNNTCDPNASCSNTVGSYVCTCNDGFLGNGTSCTSVNGSSTTAGTGSQTSGNATGSGSTTANATSSTTGGGLPTTGSSSSDSEGFPTTGTNGNTLQVQTIGNSDSIAPGSTSTTTGDNGLGLIKGQTSASDSNENEKKILVGVFVGFIGLVIVAVAIIVVVVIRRRRRANTWA